jgi:hypothetical protein
VESELLAGTELGSLVGFSNIDVPRTPLTYILYTKIYSKKNSSPMCAYNREKLLENKKDTENEFYVDSSSKNDLDYLFELQLLEFL